MKPLGEEDSLNVLNRNIISDHNGRVRFVFMILSEYVSSETPNYGNEKRRSFPRAEKMSRKFYLRAELKVEWQLPSVKSVVMM